LWFPKLAARWQRKLQYWAPFWPDIGSTLQRFLALHINPLGEHSELGEPKYGVTERSN
jgi:hypothetical protein